MGRDLRLLRLRARADLSLAFWPRDMKKACFFASLMISSDITFRLKRRSALSMDSPWLTTTVAITSLRSKTDETRARRVRRPAQTCDSTFDSLLNSLD